MKQKQNNEIEIYVDGSCSGNPGHAGIGAIILYKDKRKEISEYIGEQTNNIAELTALLRALQALKRKDMRVKVYTDSNYLIGVLTKNWKLKKNVELIQKIYNLMQSFTNLTIEKVPAHSGVELNERADELAKQAAFNPPKKFGL